MLTVPLQLLLWRKLTLQSSRATSTDPHSVALGAAGYSIARKIYTDKTLRLTRSGGVSHRDTSDTKKGTGANPGH